ncbi:hypothetical protein GCM10011348_04700 [Marinobacterium nitratireducens]|uniref:Uncharacterized protein n=1 Tax=Marinobacterium nitratireducens TaxID=518897 RepID=A0A917Z6S6_9GAMM|nr:hypothetical protein [Marinobacterium nitratireducens]GGO76751.1 hypothetical protein GCM10011348_04700 [Marinobacterium nitratireducens]
MAVKSKYYIDWNVGGWNCEKNARSRDALVILDPQQQLVGTPWRGNLRATIHAAIDDRDWIERLIHLVSCVQKYPVLN